MKYRLHIADEAQRNMEDQTQWYAEQSQSQSIAETWFAGVLEAAASLGDNPNRFGLAHESEHFDYDLREMLYRSSRRKTHRVLFRVVGSTVEVLAIRHFAQRDVTADDL